MLSSNTGCQEISTCHTRGESEESIAHRLLSKQMRDLWNPGQTYPDVENAGIYGLQNGLMSSNTLIKGYSGWKYSETIDKVIWVSSKSDSYTCTFLEGTMPQIISPIFLRYAQHRLWFLLVATIFGLSSSAGQEMGGIIVVEHVTFCGLELIVILYFTFVWIIKSRKYSS